MTHPPITPAGEDQPTTEAGRPPCGEVAALAQQIAGVGGGPAGADESPGRRGGDLARLDGQVAELTRLLAGLSQDQEGQLDENERLDRQLGALGQDVETQRHAIADLENHLDDCVFRRIRSLSPGFSDAAGRRPRSGRRLGVLSPPGHLLLGIWFVVCPSAREFSAVVLRAVLELRSARRSRWGDRPPMPMAPGFPSNHGGFLDSSWPVRVIFAVSSGYRTPVHFVPWRPLVRGPRWSPDAPRAGLGQAGACRFSCPGGRRRLSAQGRASRVPVPGSWTVRGRPAGTAGLDAEGRPRTLARHVPRPQRGSSSCQR